MKDAWRPQRRPRGRCHMATSQPCKRSRAVILQDGRCKLQDVKRSAVPNNGTTEITIECLRVCKWQHSFTLRSVGKVDYNNGN